jgi:hypothetical protein
MISGIALAVDEHIVSHKLINHLVWYIVIVVTMGVVHMIMPLSISIMPFSWIKAVIPHHLLKVR